jgi:hypothetical protein
MLERRSGTYQGMSRKRQLLKKIEDAGRDDPLPVPLTQEDCLELPQLLRDCQHLIGREFRSVVEHG